MKSNNKWDYDQRKLFIVENPPKIVIINKAKLIFIFPLPNPNNSMNFNISDFQKDQLYLSQYYLNENFILNSIPNFIPNFISNFIPNFKPKKNYVYLVILIFMIS